MNGFPVWGEPHTSVFDGTIPLYILYICTHIPHMYLGKLQISDTACYAHVR